MTDIKTFPAPWLLKGYGYILLFKARAEWLRAHGFINPEMWDRYIPSIGAVMLVNYLESTAGPYGELLFIPGKFSFPGGNRYSISKIYVSSMESVVNGQNNWGIPKELADFDFALRGDGSEEFRVSLPGQLIAKGHFSSSRAGIPVTTSILPKKICTVAQYRQGSVFYTALRAKSRLKMARLKEAQFNAGLFPDLNQVRILGAFKAERMTMEFTEALISKPGKKEKGL